MLHYLLLTRGLLPGTDTEPDCEDNGMRTRTMATLGLCGVLLVGAGSALSAGRGDTRARVEVRIATVDIFRALQAYMQRPEYEQARQAQTDQLVAREAELRTRIQQNQQKLQLLTPNDPELATTQAALQADTQAYREFQQTAQMMAQGLAIEQSTRAFIEVHEQARALATELGYTHLLATRLDTSDLMSDEGATSQTTSQIIQELLARSVLMAPSEDDLTDRLMERMDLLQYEQQADEGDEPASGAQAPGAGG